MKTIFTLLFAVATFVVVSPPSYAADQPNIMVFLVDDMGMMDTSVPFLTDDAGNPKRYPLNDYYRTPGMERLAAQGVRFNQFYAMSVCSPTRVSIMTGQNAARHRTTNWINPRQDNRGTNGAPDWNWTGLKEGDVTLPGLLRGQGYTTIHVGKGHFGPTGYEGAEPLNLGFDVNVAGAAFGAPGSYYAEKNYGAATKRAHHAVPGLEQYHGSDTFLTEALTIEAKKRVTETVQADKPFYLYFSHYAVHAPFDSDPRFADHYKDSGKPANAQAFATLIEGMDKSLGDMLDHFEELGVAENTLIFFLGDNGSDAPLGHQHAVACAEPLRGKKGAHYDGGMRVPLIAAWAKRNPDNVHQQTLKIRAGAIQHQVASVEDLFPTLMQFTATKVPQNHVVDGSPLQALLTGEPDAKRPQQFLMHYPHGPHRSNYFTVWRDGDWKVIYHALPETKTSGGHIQFADGNYELFNLADDPFESTNLAKSRPEVLKQMMQGMIAALQQHDAVYPIDDSGNAVVPQLP
ncbi:Arylsulfatase [Stieleria maiorica]|uniref:Arylsulfatase n=1 Tax=Stieleria maiorica TaxID=2795974 RepID=A0A5B9MH07_9BACT|nr:sulfatase-like hydrolase/transferase [Stieleria maiorica]QEF99789.1 Arylsulfatase [Stieleria maiorica]